MTKNLLMAGCGDLGTGLGETLAADGWTVWGLRRSTEGLPPTLRGWAADLTRPETLRPLPASFDAVVYTATPDRYDEAGYRQAYVTGVHNLLDALAAQSQPPSRVILVSSTSVYAQNTGEDVDETSPTEPTHYAGRTILEGERAMQALGERGVIVRFGGIYGPHRTQLLDSVRQGKAVCYEGPPRYTNRIHRDDCVGVLGHLLTLPETAPLYLGVDNEPAPRDDVLRWLAAQLGRPEPPTAPGSDAPTGRRTRSNKRCRNRRLRDSGYAFLYPSFREGYRAMIASSQD